MIDIFKPSTFEERDNRREYINSVYTIYDFNIKEFKNKIRKLIRQKQEHIDHIIDDIVIKNIDIDNSSYFYKLYNTKYGCYMSGHDKSFLDLLYIEYPNIYYNTYNNLKKLNYLHKDGYYTRLYNDGYYSNIEHFDICLRNYMHLVESKTWI